MKRGTISRLQLIRRLNEARLEHLVDPSGPEDMGALCTVTCSELGPRVPR